jgi:hypothetical protein
MRWDKDLRNAMVSFGSMLCKMRISSLSIDFKRVAVALKDLSSFSKVGRTFLSTTNILSFLDDPTPMMDSLY